MTTLVPLGSRRIIAGIAKMRVEYSVKGGETRESNGRTTTWTTEVQKLSLLDPDDRELWSASEDHVIDASPAELGADIRAIGSGARNEPVVRIQAFWPVLLFSSFGVMFFFGPIVSQIGMALRDRQDLVAEERGHTARSGSALRWIVEGVAASSSASASSGAGSRTGRGVDRRWPG